MKRLAVLLLLGILFSASYTLAAEEYYLKIRIESRAELESLTRVVSIDNVIDNEVYAYANERELSELKRLGYGYTVLPHPSTLIIPEMYTFDKGVWQFDTYPTYDTYVDMMDSFAVAFPSLCVIENIGSTVQGRAILYAKISDNVNIDEDEPEILYVSSIHGDETTGYVLMLRLISYLLNNYGSDSLATRLVDSCEIWINPLANPDGTYYGGNSSVSGARRYNANGYDLNRNCPDPEDGQYPGGTRQIETTHIMNFAGEHSFTMGFNLHGGAEVANYPWDTWSRRHADDAWWQYVCRQWVDTVHLFGPSGYMTDLENGITNGYDWYSISGGRQDYMNFYHHCREMTLEISSTKMVTQSQLPSFWNYNYRSFLNYMEQALYGVRGIVTDIGTGLPLAAKVKILNHDLDSSDVVTDPDVGDYHRPLAAGTYTLLYTAAGYLPDTVYGVTVANEEGLRLDVALSPVPNEPLVTYVTNNGGLVDPGDNISMKITLGNYGGISATGGTGTLSTTDPYITITQNYSTYPTMAAQGGTGLSNANYQFTVAADCPTNYTGLFQIAVTADGGYSTNVPFSIVIGQPVEDFETANFTKFDWTMSGPNGWLIATSPVYQGTRSARSGTTANNSYSQMAVTLEVAQAGNISFYYRVSSESGYDYLRFLIDDVQMGSWSGTISTWTQASFNVSAGTHTFAWKYTKDVSGVSGSDCGWVDFIVFPQLAGQLQIITAALPDWTYGLAYSQQLQASGGSGALTWTDDNGGLVGSGLSLSADGLLSGTPTATGFVNFQARVTDESTGDAHKSFSIKISPAVTITTASLPDGEMGTAYNQTLTVTGGTGTKSWTDKNGDLAAYGLTLSSGGILSGTPTQAGTVSFVARVADAVGAFDEETFEFAINPVCLCGDADNSGIVDVLDIIYLIDNKYKGGPDPAHPECCDVNHDGIYNLLDIIYLIDFKFKGGPAPDCIG